MAVWNKWFQTVFYGRDRDYILYEEVKDKTICSTGKIMLKKVKKR